MMTRRQCLQALAEQRTDEIVLGAMTASREWASLSSHDLDMPVMGAMGQAPDIGLGIALAQPERRVVVLNGDGSMLMNLGSLVTIANAAPANLVLMVVENGVYEITGGQPLPGIGKFSFAALARAAGFTKVYEYEELPDFQASIPILLKEEGPVFATLKVKGGPIPETPRPNMLAVTQRIRSILAEQPARPVAQ